MRTKTNMELVFMCDALALLKRAKDELKKAGEPMMSGRVGALAQELDIEIGKWEVTEARRNAENR